MHGSKEKISLWSVNGRGGLELSNPRLSGRNVFRLDATLTVDGETYSIEVELSTPFREQLLAFFHNLAVNSRQGVASHVSQRVTTWRSDFSEISMNAVSQDDQSVRIAILFQWPPTYAEDVGHTLLVKANDVARVSNELRSFLRLPLELQSDAS